MEEAARYRVRLNLENKAISITLLMPYFYGAVMTAGRKRFGTG